MRKIIWTEDFTLGIEPFDSHHKRLISLINETTACMESDTQHEDVINILNSLIDYASYHFSAEEEWLKERGYPQLVEHKNIHTMFFNKIRGFQEQLLDGKNAISEELSDYLSFWLVDHILICDSLYAAFAGTRTEPVIMI